MKYIIMLYGTQRDYDLMAGRGGEGALVSPQDFAPMYEFMGTYHQGLAESGELVDAQGLASPVLTRRVALKDGAPVVTDGPFSETEEVLAGYTVVECASFDRATEIAAGFADCPYPANAPGEFRVDIRPLVDSAADLET